MALLSTIICTIQPKVVYNILNLSNMLIQLFLQKFNGKLFFESAHVIFNRNVIENHQIIISPNKRSFNITCNVTTDYIQDPWIKAGLHKKNRKSNRFQTIFQFDKIICHMVGMKSTTLVTSLITEFLKLTQGSIKCPPRKVINLKDVTNKIYYLSEISRVTIHGLVLVWKV